MSDTGLFSFEEREERERERQHEQAMRRTHIKLAQIEAREAVAVARASSRAWIVSRNWYIGAVLIAVIVTAIAISCVVYYSLPGPRERDKIEKDKYEICMQVEKDQQKCTAKSNN